MHRAADEAVKNQLAEAGIDPSQVDTLMCQEEAAPLQQTTQQIVDVLGLPKNGSSPPAAVGHSAQKPASTRTRVRGKKSAEWDWQAESWSSGGKGGGSGVHWRGRKQW